MNPAISSQTISNSPTLTKTEVNPQAATIKNLKHIIDQFIVILVKSYRQEKPIYPNLVTRLSLYQKRLSELQSNPPQPEHLNDQLMHIIISLDQFQDIIYMAYQRLVNRQEFTYYLKNFNPFLHLTKLASNQELQANQYFFEVGQAEKKSWQYTAIDFNGYEQIYERFYAICLPLICNGNTKQQGYCLNDYATAKLTSSLEKLDPALLDANNQSQINQFRDSLLNCIKLTFNQITTIFSPQDKIYNSINNLLFGEEENLEPIVKYHHQEVTPIKIITVTPPTPSKVRKKAYLKSLPKRLINANLHLLNAEQFKQLLLEILKINPQKLTSSYIYITNFSEIPRQFQPQIALICAATLIFHELHSTNHNNCDILASVSATNEKIMEIIRLFLKYKGYKFHANSRTYKFDPQFIKQYAADIMALKDNYYQMVS